MEDQQLPPVRENAELGSVDVFGPPDEQTRKHFGLDTPAPPVPDQTFHLADLPSSNNGQSEHTPQQDSSELPDLSVDYDPTLVRLYLDGGVKYDVWFDMIIEQDHTILLASRDEPGRGFISIDLGHRVVIELCPREGPSKRIEVVGTGDPYKFQGMKQTFLIKTPQEQE